ncbi:MAG: S8 family peptidase, partial [Gammaproteobacteria bacterium]
RFTSPKSGRAKPTKTPPRDRQNHAGSLIRELTSIEKTAPEIVRDQKAFGLDALNGIYLSFESEPDFDLKFDSLEFQPSGIELCSVKSADNRTIATVFVPEGKLAHFLNKITAYKDEDTRKGKPKNKPLVESISHIRLAALEALWTDPADLFPAPSEVIWWEVWLRNSEQMNHEAFLRDHAEQLGMSVSKEAIHFLDRTVLLVQGTPEQMSHSVYLLASFAELRKAKNTAAFFTGLDHVEQQEWVDHAVKRLEPPHEKAPTVCALDTGVNQAHPLLKPVSAPDDMHTYEPAWGSDDRYGHGTPMAGLAAYGDLTEPLASSEPILLKHRIESVKVTPSPDYHNDRHLYGAITRESISRVEIKPERQRVFCMAITSKDGLDRGRPSSWSATIDALASGYEDEQRRLIVVSAGNTDQGARHQYPHSNMTDPVHDPGQAWNTLTVGAYTEKVILDTAKYPGWQPIAPKGDLSPASCTAMEWSKNWPVKPDIVMEGGNMSLSPEDGTADYIDDGLQLLSTHHQFALGKSLVSFGDTSAATALAARLAAMLQAEYPQFWPETLRALLIHSAQWTKAMKARFPLRTKEDYRKLLRYCGYGAPNQNDLFWSARDSLTLIAQDQLQPFFKEDGQQVKTRDINYQSIPWPAETLSALGVVDVEMRVTLSYFVEPNPGERGLTKKYSYQSHGLRFDVRRSLESLDAFEQPINRQARDDGASASGDTGEWVLGDRLRVLGSVHSDIWRGTAVELAERGHVAVYPVLGWW